MIEILFNRGLYLPEMDFWLDPFDPKENAFVSHAHADHFARHESLLCSTVTAALLEKRFGISREKIEAVGFGAMIDRGDFRLRLLPAGHVVGSAMIHITRKSDGATLLYTGDFKVRRSRTAEMVNFLQADTLVMETTFGLPHLVFPPQMEVEAQVLRFVNDAFDDGEIPILFAYSLGKAQEAIALLSENQIPILSHPKVMEMSEVCRQVGLKIPEPVLFEGGGKAGHVIVAPPNAVNSKLIRGIKNRRTAMLSGWALQPGSLYRYKVDEVIPLSDHADHPGLLECITRVRPKRVLTVHGSTKEFASELRRKGIDAWSVTGGDQLELSLDRSNQTGIAKSSPRQIRPICQLADFSDVCQLIAGTSSRLAKIDYLQSYLKKLDGEGDLAIAVRWFSGEALPRRDGQRTLNMGAATIKRAILSLPGVKPDRYQQVSTIQNDLARTARIVLQEIALQPTPVSLAELYEFFERLAGATGSLEKVDLMAERLFESHPTEVELITKLLTGDLRIGLKEGLVEEGIAKAFAASAAEVRRANMLTGDLGKTAVLAKEGQLDQAELTPLVPIRCMLAAPLERNEESDLPEFQRLSFSPPFWLEPKYDGIRMQLHKVGKRVGLFSRDLRPLNGEFPELVDAAKQARGDFILDGELIAYAKGRKLGFSDLQKRLGRKKAEADLFQETNGTGIAGVPLKFVAFDLLWSDGEELLNLALWERREKLEELDLPELMSLIEIYAADDADAIEEYFKRSLKDEHEGLIAKDPQSLYSPGRRGKSWIKLKGVMPTLDCVVVFAEQGHGKRAGVLSDYTFAVRDEESGELRVLGKAYSGLTDLEIEELTEHFLTQTISKERRKHRVTPDVVLEIAFDSIRRSSRHDSGLALRFPRIKSIRKDKPLSEIDTLRTAMSLLNR